MTPAVRVGWETSERPGDTRSLESPPAVRYARRVSRRTAVRMEPAEERAQTSGGEPDAGVGGAVIEVNAITVGRERVAAGEDYVADVAIPLVWCFV